jgi:hypothetical protein
VNDLSNLTPEQFQAQKQAAAKEGMLQRDAIALDVAINVATGGLPDETISSRLERDAEQHRLLGVLGVKILDALQPHHGAYAQAGDTERAEAVIATEKKFDGSQE